MNTKLIGNQSDPPSIQYELHSSSNGVCINCSFLDSAATEYVVVIQFKYGGLMNIESSLKFNRSGDEAYGCIEGVNLTDYLVGVVKGKIIV